MTTSAATRPSTALGDQLKASAVDFVNSSRMAAEAAALSAQQTALDSALAAMDEVRKFISAPEKILGSEKTKQIGRAHV